MATVFLWAGSGWRDGVQSASLYGAKVCLFDVGLIGITV